MRTLRTTLNGLILCVPLAAILLLGALTVRRVFAYLNSNARLVGTISAEATRALGRPVVVRDVRVTGNLWGLDAPNRIELSGVTIADGDGAKSLPFARAKKITVWYNLRQAALSSDLHVPIVDQLIIQQPEGFVARNAKGRWNFEELLKPSALPGRRLTDRLGIADASLSYNDLAFPHAPSVPPSLLRTRVDHLTGVVLSRPDGAIAFNGRGADAAGLAGPFQLTAVFDPKTRRGSLHFAAGNVDLAALAARAIPRNRLIVGSGLANVDIAVTYTPSATGRPDAIDWTALDVRGTAVVADASARGPALPTELSHLSGSLVFSRTSAAADLRGTVAGMDAALQGRVIGFDLPMPGSSGRQAKSNPYVALKADLPKVDLAQLVKVLRPAGIFAHVRKDAARQIASLRGSGSAVIEVDGPLSNPNAAVRASVQSLSAAGQGASNVTVSALLNQGRLDAEVAGAYASGTVSARAHVDSAARGAFRAELHTAGIDLSRVGLKLPGGLRGRLTADGLVSGASGTAPTVDAQVRLTEGSVNGTRLPAIYARAAGTTQKLIVRTLQAQDARAVLHAVGSVNLVRNQVDLQVQADQIDLGRVAGLLKLKDKIKHYEPITGMAYVRARIAGSLARPDISGELAAYNVKSGDLAVDRLQARVTANQNRIEITQGDIRKYPGSAQFYGAIRNPSGRDPAFTATATNVRDIDIGQAMRAAGIESGDNIILGTVSVPELRIGGTASRISLLAPMQVSLDNAYINGLRIDQARLRATPDGDGFRLEASDVPVGGGRVSVAGTVTGDRRLDVVLNGRGIDLEQLGDALPKGVPLRLGGKLDTLDAHITGTLKDPAMTASWDAKDVLVNEIYLADARGAADLANRQIVVHDVILSDADSPVAKGGQIRLALLRYDMAAGGISMDSGQPITLNSVPVAWLREIIANSPLVSTDQRSVQLDTLIANVSAGVVSGTALVSGTASAPSIDLSLDARDLVAYGRKISSVTATVQATNKDISVPRAVISLPLTSHAAGAAAQQVSTPILEARGLRAIYGGAVSGDISGTNLSLASLSAYAAPGMGSAVGGVGDIYISASGRTESPILDVSVNLRNVTYRGQVIDRVDLDHATVKEGAIQADSLRFVKTDRVAGSPVSFVATARGSVGFSWKPPFIAADAPLMLRAETPNQPLRALALVTPGVGRNSDGTFAIVATIGGTRAAPLLGGSVSVQAPRLQFAGMSTGLVDLAAQLNFEGDRITVAPGFHAHTQVFKKGVAVAGKVGSPIVLAGSIPLGLAEGREQPGTIHLMADSIPFDEAPLPLFGSGTARGVAKVDVNLLGSLHLREAIDLLTTAPGEAEGTVAARFPQRGPRLEGDVTIVKAQLTLPRDFGVPSAPGFVLPVNADFNIRMHVARGARLVSTALNASGQGEFTLMGRRFTGIRGENGLKLAGHLDVASGQLILPTARFKIIPPAVVTVRFPDTQLGDPSLAVNVDMHARTHLTATSVGGTRKRYQVDVFARGPVLAHDADPLTGSPRLALTFRTDPPDLGYTQNAITQKLAGALVGTDMIRQAGRDPGQAVASALSNVFTSAVLPGLFERPAEDLGFEELSVNYDPVQRLTLVASRQIAGPLYVTYVRSLAQSHEQYNLKFSLRFKDSYQLSFDTDDQHTRRVLLEGVFRF